MCIVKETIYYEDNLYRNLKFNSYFKVYLIILLFFLCLPVNAKEELYFLYPAKSGYQPDIIMAEAKKFMQNNPNVEVKITFPHYDEQYNLILKSASGEKPLYDVVCVDCIWTAKLATLGYILPVDNLMTFAEIKDFSPAVLDAFVYKEKLWGKPFLANFQLLFYNENYLSLAGFDSPPVTLEEWENQMEVIKEKGIVKYPLMDSWNRREGLICDFVLFTGAFGGDVFDKEGKPVFNRGAGVKALETMVRWIKMGLVHPYAVNPPNPASDEILAKDLFIKGECAFITNWTFVYGWMNNPEVSKIVGYGRMGLIPPSETVYRPLDYIASSVSGFQALSIMANSRHKELAWKFIQFITREQFQKEHLEEMPVSLAVQNDPEVIQKDPVMNIKSIALSSVHNRPKLVNYPEISAIMQDYIFRALNYQISPQEALDKAAEEIDAILKMPQR